VYRRILYSVAGEASIGTRGAKRNRVARCRRNSSGDGNRKEPGGLSRSFELRGSPTRGICRGASRLVALVLVGWKHGLRGVSECEIAALRKGELSGTRDPGGWRGMSLTRAAEPAYELHGFRGLIIIIARAIHSAHACVPHHQLRQLLQSHKKPTSPRALLATRTLQRLPAAAVRPSRVQALVVRTASCALRTSPRPESRIITTTLPVVLRRAPLSAHHRRSMEDGA